MSAKVSDMFFVRRRSTEPTMVPPSIRVEDGRDSNTRVIVGTMANSMSPLTTSMKLFGLYFKRPTNNGDKSPCRWNVYMIHSVAVVILMWANAIRMFSVFKNISDRLLFCYTSRILRATNRDLMCICVFCNVSDLDLLISSMICIRIQILFCISASCSRCSQHKTNLDLFSSSSLLSLPSCIR